MTQSWRQKAYNVDVSSKWWLPEVNRNECEVDELRRRPDLDKDKVESENPCNIFVRN